MLELNIVVEFMVYGMDLLGSASFRISAMRHVSWAAIRKDLVEALNQCHTNIRLASNDRWRCM
jgi:hypothetical protein